MVDYIFSLAMLFQQIELICINFDSVGSLSMISISVNTAQLFLSFYHLIAALFDLHFLPPTISLFSGFTRLLELNNKRGVLSVDFLN